MMAAIFLKFFSPWIVGQSASTAGGAAVGVDTAAAVVAAAVVLRVAAADHSGVLLQGIGGHGVVQGFRVSYAAAARGQQRALLCGEKVPGTGDRVSLIFVKYD